MIERTLLYKRYCEYCEENERTPLTKNGFYKNLRNKGFVECTIDGKRYFKGLKFKEKAFSEPMETIPFD